MEKYTNYRDNGTGISPFMPSTSHKNVTNGHNIIYSIFMTIIFIIKIIILTPILLCLIGVTFNGSMSYLLMKLLFHYQIDVTVQGKSKRVINKARDYPNRGSQQLYICNYTSPLDAVVCYIMSQDHKVLYLVAHENEIYGMRFWKFIQYTLAQDHSQLVKNGEKIPHWEEVRKDYTCFLFAEGTTSNGKSVLPFAISDPFLQEFITGGQEEEKERERETNHHSTLDMSQYVTLLQLKHTPGRMACPIPCHWRHFLWTLLHVTKPHTRAKLIPLASVESSTNTNKTTMNWRTLLNSGRTPIGKALDYQAKQRFLTEYLGNARR